MKISKKQLEVLEKINTHNTVISYIRGISPYCYIVNFRSYNISIPTLYKLIDLNLVEVVVDDVRWTDYKISELGRGIISNNA